MILMLDNYDSFTYNLVQYLGELGADVRVLRNDECTVADIAAMRPDGIVISPGPCTPNEAGIALDLIRELAPELPLLGVCLGHQSIAQAFGGQVVQAREVMHGKTSRIHHNGHGIFAGLDNPFIATRYHSLVVDDLPNAFEVTAWTETPGGERDVIMGLIHTPTGAEGIQFHPESILSEHGHAMLDTFLNRTRAHS